MIEIIRDGLEKLVEEQPWAPTYVAQWTLSRLIKPSVEYAKVLNLDFKGSCNLWLGCIGTRILLDVCGLCFSSFEDQELKRFIFDLENVFVDNRPNFDWCVAHLSSLFPVKFISNILRMPSMFTPNFITSTITVLEHLSNTGDQKLKILLREIVEEALNSDLSELKSKDYIPNLIQLSSKSEIYSQAVLNVFLEYIEQDCNDFMEKITKQIILRPLDYNSERLHDTLPELIMRCKTYGTKLLLKIADKIENHWTSELIELILVEMELEICNDDRNCALIADIRNDKNWPLLWDGCASSKYLLQQTSIRMILLASNQRNSILHSKTIEKLLSENTYTKPHILKALLKLLDDSPSDDLDVNIAIFHALQQLLVDINNVKKQNKCFFMLKNIFDIISIEKGGNCIFLRRNPITAALQSSLSIIIQIWEELLRKVMLHSNMTSVESTGKVDDLCTIINNDDLLEIADIESECVYGTKDQIHMLSNIINHLNVKVLNTSNAVHAQKATVKYFFWSLMEADTLTKSIAMERCFSLLSKQCSAKKGIKTTILRDLLEGALFLYPKVFTKQRESVTKEVQKVRENSLFRMHQRQVNTLSFSKSSILLHSGLIGSGISKKYDNLKKFDIDDETKNYYIKALVSCCEEDAQDSDSDKSKILESLCNVSHLLVELVSSDVMYNGQFWSNEDDFTKITMERDLHVRRIFKFCPILWSILGLLAQYRIPLRCNCVLGRALCGSIIHHWRAKAENEVENSEELMFFTVKFLELLALAKLLPPPLNYLHIVVIFLDPSEISYVLKECVWNYFVAKTTNSFDQTNQNQFINPLRNTMQKKLSILGNLYYQMKFK